MEIEDRLRALLLQGLDADAAAYQRFLKELSAHLRAFLRRRLAQWPDAVEDLVQETLLAVHNQRHTYQPQMPVTAWVHAIARYKLVDWLRSHAVKEARNDPLDDAHELFSSSDAEAAEARRDLERFFGKTVFLETYVKVDKDWRSSDKELRNFGYQLDEKKKIHTTVIVAKIKCVNYGKFSCNRRTTQCGQVYLI